MSSSPVNVISGNKYKPLIDLCTVCYRYFDSEIISLILFEIQLKFSLQNFLISPQVFFMNLHDSLLIKRIRKFIYKYINDLYKYF